jgi:dihydrolipoamide dehydrogenase
MAKILGEQRGLVKIITDQDYGQILGVHIVGPRATSLIPEAALAMKLEATAQDIIATMHAHPTLSEAIWEAALDVTGEAIHFHSRRH